MFDKHEIRRVFGKSDFSHGKACFDAGHVVVTKFETDSLIIGQVLGTSPNVYSVSISFTMTDDRWLSSVDSSCTCPDAFNCKHAVAVLLSIEKKMLEMSLESGIQTALPVIPDQVSNWLGHWPEATVETAVSLRRTGSLTLGQEHLFYVIYHDRRRGACISPYRGYLKKDGAIGKNSELVERTSLWFQKNLTVQDAGLVGKLDFFADRNYSYHRHYCWPDGETLIDLIREIVETGRARNPDIHGVSLNWVPSRRCELRWESGKSGEQCLVARDEAGCRLTLLPFPTPFFIDSTSGSTGVAEISLTPQLGAWLAEAPTVSREVVDMVDMTLSILSRVGRYASVPRLHHTREQTEVPPVPILTLYGCEQSPSWYRSHYAWQRGNAESAVRTIYPCARLEVSYKGASVLVYPGEECDLWSNHKNGPATIKRDYAREMAFHNILQMLAGDLSRELENRYWDDNLPDGVYEADIVFPSFNDEDDHKSMAASLGFVSKTVPLLRAEGWHVEIEDTWPFPLCDDSVAFSTSLEPSDSEWFSLSLSMEMNGHQFDITPIVLQVVETLPVDGAGQLEDGFNVDRYLADQAYYLRSDDGKYLVINGALIARFVEAFLEAQGLIGFHRAESGRLFELVETLDGCGAPWTGNRELLELGARLRSLTDVSERAPPDALHGELRPYQCIGYNWLRALSDSGFGGLLADDMGLGKTVQILALLAYRHLEQKTDHPSLLVVPTSLVGNWRREAAHFVPELRLLILHGSDRHQRFAEIVDHHLIVTTYPLLKRDHDVLFRHDYDTAVLDEAQMVKNPAAAVSKRIREIRARHRLALTGTPIENSLQELWALYDWLIPGLLGNRKAFVTHYRTPIEKHGDQRRQQQLSTRIKPFLMRRTKQQVALELPEKTIIDELILLEGDQAALYESIRTAMDTRVRDAIAARGLAASRIAILDALLKLRQVCCDPCLVKLDAARKVKHSAKRTRLLELLEELVVEGRRVLVFSQFVEMLRLIEQDVATRGWGYAMLHGGTRDRDAQISSFQQGDQSLFLISLKTGGIGLNLTVADTVIIYDPWWNPAVERQAMDRAHRIGQDEPVFVYRLLTERTVEAAIQTMQIRKQTLADTLFEGTGQGPLALTEADIEALFAAR